MLQPVFYQFRTKFSSKMSNTQAIGSRISTAESCSYISRPLGGGLSALPLSIREHNRRLGHLSRKAGAWVRLLIPPPYGIDGSIATYAFVGPLP